MKWTRSVWARAWGVGWSAQPRQEQRFYRKEALEWVLASSTKTGPRRGLDLSSIPWIPRTSLSAFYSGARPLKARFITRLPFQWLCCNASPQVDRQSHSIRPEGSISLFLTMLEPSLVERINPHPLLLTTNCNCTKDHIWIRSFSLDQQSHTDFNQISCHYCGCLSSSMFFSSQRSQF